MGLLSYFQKRQPLAEYKRLRTAGRYLNQDLVRRLPKGTMLECAKKLGLRKGKSLSFQNEGEMPVLFDYCLYNHRRAGKNIIEKYLEDSPPAETSDEMTLLRAMVKAHYSVFMVEEIQNGMGATLFDLLRHDRLSLIDIGIGTTARRGMIFGGRVLPLGDFYMTSGAFVPLWPDIVERIVIPALEKFCPDAHAEDLVELSHSQEAAFSGQVIRAALKAGALKRMAYE